MESDATTRLLERARSGDAAAYEALVLPHRRELFAHCYRMLASTHDAEDALQEALLGAWRGLSGYEGRASLRTWLFRITTNSCLRIASRTRARITSPDLGPGFTRTRDLGAPVVGPWVEPLPHAYAGWPNTEHTTPEAAVLERESIELAFIAALQRLPTNQRAVLVLRDVLQFSASEVAEQVGGSEASVNSALQRARKSVARAGQARSQHVELSALGDEQRHLLAEFVAAWERMDIDALVRLLTKDVTFTMPPLPAWFDGVNMVRRFLQERIAETPWRLVPVQANGQPGLACYQGPLFGGPGGHADSDPATFRFSAVCVLSLRDGKVSRIQSFLEPAVLSTFHLPLTFGEFPSP